MTREIAGALVALLWLGMCATTGEDGYVPEGDRPPQSEELFDRPEK